MNIAIVSPGQMGVSVGLSLAAVGHTIFFRSGGRSPKTINTAIEHGFRQIQDVGEIAETCEAVICIGTGDIAFQTPQELFMQTKFAGLYLDLNSLNGENEEKKWRSMMDNLTDNYAEGAVRGYPFQSVPKHSESKHFMLLSGKQAHDAYGLFAPTMWHIQYTETYAKLVNRCMAQVSANNDSLYQDKTSTKDKIWEHNMLDLVADKYYINNRTGAETMIFIWQEIQAGKLRDICKELLFPEHLGFIHAINTFGKHLTANNSLHLPRSDKNLWHDPESL